MAIDPATLKPSVTFHLEVDEDDPVVEYDLDAAFEKILWAVTGAEDVSVVSREDDQAVWWEGFVRLERFDAQLVADAGTLVLEWADLHGHDVTFIP